MLMKSQDFAPQKIMKTYRMVRDYKLYTSIQQYRPSSIEEISYFVSRCLEVKRREKLLFQKLS